MVNLLNVIWTVFMAEKRHLTFFVLSLWMFWVATAVGQLLSLLCRMVTTGRCFCRHGHTWVDIDGHRYRDRRSSATSSSRQTHSIQTQWTVVSTVTTWIKCNLVLFCCYVRPPTAERGIKRCCDPSVRHEMRWDEIRKLTWMLANSQTNSCKNSKLLLNLTKSGESKTTTLLRWLQLYMFIW